MSTPMRQVDQSTREDLLARAVAQLEDALRIVDELGDCLHVGAMIDNAREALQSTRANKGSN